MFVFPQFLFLISISIIISVQGNDPTKFAEDTLSEIHGEIFYSSAFSTHGDTAPLSQYSSDPHKELSTWQKHWPQGPGNLSQIGRLQEFNLGKWFNKRYNSLITTENRDQVVKMDSSTEQRTILSAKFFLHGFFYPSKNDIPADEAVDKEEVVDVNFNQFISFDVECNKYNLEVEKIRKLEEFNNFYVNNKKTFNRIEENTDMKFFQNNGLRAIKDACTLYDTLFIEDLYGLPLPGWTKAVYPEPLKSMIPYYLLSNTFTSVMKKLRAGPLLREIVKEMESKIENNSNTTLHFHSSHDSTIFSLLVALGLSDAKRPPYAASLFFELRRKDSYNVTIMYRTTTTSPPIQLEHQKCKGVCPFGKFKTLVEEFISEDWDKDCENSPNPEIPNLL